MKIKCRTRGRPLFLVGNLIATRGDVFSLELYKKKDTARGGWKKVELRLLSREGGQFADRGRVQERKTSYEETGTMLR